MSKKILFLIFISFFFISSAYSEDLITKRDGKQILCTINKEDSSNVYITLNIKGTDVDSYIQRSEIQNIYYNYKEEKEKKATSITPISSSSLQGTSDLPFAFIRNKLSLSMGPSLATGDFGSQSLDNENAGLAKTGISFNFFYQHFWTPHIGIGVKSFCTINDIDKESLINGLNKTTDLKWSTSDDISWDCTGLLAGLTFDFKDDYDTHYEINMLCGPMALGSPKIKYTLSSNSYSYIKQDDATATNWGYNIGIGVSKQISKKWYLLANIDYMACNFKFKEIDSSMLLYNYYYEQTASDVPMKFKTINITFGIGYIFNKK